MIEMEDTLKNNYEIIKYFKEISPRTYQLLGYLGYNKEREIEATYGTWTIYTKRNFSFPYFNIQVSIPVNRFVAIYKNNNRNMVVYGSFEKDTDEIEKRLMVLTDIMLSPVKKFLGIPTTLTEENAQDYGYIRGVIFGIVLILADFVYSWTFALREGVFTSFIEYIKKVYEGSSAGITNFVGITWTGMYFGIPLILMPIIYGHICVRLAKRKRIKQMKKIEEIASSYEFGIKAEQALEEEFTTIVEEKRKQAIYEEISKITDKLDRDGFETLYTNIRSGFISPEAIDEFIKEFKELVGEGISFEKFVEIVVKYQKAEPSTEIGIK
ncbi:MAG: hypothetical protein NC932_01395 [Candidatus Omnitrophica bacterium]|nr:hypothetical protein [Candidatus Omnitrophota bacterium]